MSRIPDSNDAQSSSEILLSVIIVNYNGLSFLEKCLQALSRNLSCLYEIIIVDNNSSDGSREYLLNSWPNIRLICSQNNMGFAKGNNLGAQHARGRFLLLLNNDTEILQPVQPLINYLKKHQDTAVVGGRLRYPDGSIQASVGYDHSPLRLLFTWMLPRTNTWFIGWQIHERRHVFYQCDHPEVHWVSGAFLCIRQSTWRDLSGFDNDIFMYVEDADLCCRVRKRGEKVAFLAEADTCHFEGNGQKGITGNALISTIDSYRLLLRKQYGRLTRNLTCTGLACIFLVRAGLYLVMGTVIRDPAMNNKAGFYFRGAGRLLWGASGCDPALSAGGRKQ